MIRRNLSLGIAILLVAIIHIAMGTWAYGKLVGKEPSVFDSQILTFGGPAFLAFSGYFLVVWMGTAGESRGERCWMATGAALMFCILSSIAQMTFAFSVTVR
jgi:hypothetical protein